MNISHLPCLLKTLFSSNDETARTQLFILIEKLSLCEEEYKTIHQFLLDELKNLPQPNKDMQEQALNRIREQKKLLIEGLKNLVKKTYSTAPSIFTQELLITCLTSSETTLQSVGLGLYFSQSKDEQKNIKEFLLKKMEEVQDIKALIDMYQNLDDPSSSFIKLATSNNKDLTSLAKPFFDSLLPEDQLKIQNDVFEKLKGSTHDSDQLTRLTKIFNGFSQKPTSLFMPMFNLSLKLRNPNLLSMVSQWYKALPQEMQTKINEEALIQLGNETDNKTIDSLISLFAKFANFSSSQFIPLLKLSHEKLHNIAFNVYVNSTKEEQKTLLTAVLNEMELTTDTEKWISIYETLNKLLSTPQPIVTSQTITPEKQTPLKDSPKQDVQTSFKRKRVEEETSNKEPRRKEPTPQPQISSITGQTTGNAPQASHITLGFDSQNKTKPSPQTITDPNTTAPNSDSQTKTNMKTN